MKKMLNEMVKNYKAIIDSHRQDFEKGCYDRFEDYRKVLNDEHQNICDVCYGLLRYDAIAKDVSDEIVNDCLYYALRALVKVN